MLLYDFEKRERVSLPYNKCNVIEIPVVLEDGDFESFSKAYIKVREGISNIEGLLKENTYFVFKIEAGTNLGEVEDFFWFAMQVGSELFRFLQLPELRGESRLRVDNDNLFIAYSNLIKMINNKSKINRFGFEIVTGNGLRAVMVEE